MTLELIVQFKHFSGNDVSPVETQDSDNHEQRESQIEAEVWRWLWKAKKSPAMMILMRKS